MRLIRQRPSAALVIASLALAVSLSGTGYAALVVPRNSVGAVQLKKGAVTSIKVKDSTLKLLDFAATERFKLVGAKGDPGPQGLRGDKGDTGPTGVAALEIVSATSALSNTDQKTINVNCPSGKRLLGGGAAIAGTNTIAVTQSLPLDADTWSAQAKEVSPVVSAWEVSAYAICASVTS